MGIKQIKKRHIVFLLVGVLVLLFYQNCGEVNLLTQNSQQPAVDPAPTPNEPEVPPQPPPPLPPAPPTPIPPTVPQVGGDPLEPYILPGPPAPQFPGEPNLTPDTQGVHAGLYFYNVSQKPAACDIDTKFVKGWENASYMSGEQLIDPEYNDLSNPSIINLPPGPAGSMMADHDIRFLRPVGAAIFSFRIRTPNEDATLEASVGSQYEGRITATLLGCDFTKGCSLPDLKNFVSMSDEPCNFTTAVQSCPFDYSGKRIFKVSSNSSNPCDLKPNKIYYFNVKYPYPVIEPNIISGSNYRTEVKFRVYK